jgi:hypothetical protein
MTMKYDLFTNETDLYEMRPGWVVRLVPGENPLMSRYRHPPAVMIAMVVAGTAVQMYSQYQQGKQAEEIAEKNAAMMRNQAMQQEDRGDQEAQMAQDRAALKAKQAKAFGEEQQQELATGNIRLGVGLSTVIEADTEEKAAQEVGFIMDEGYNRRRALYGEAQASRMKADIFEQQGENARTNSYWSMGATALKGLGSLAFMGSQAGWFGGSSPGIGSVGDKGLRAGYTGGVGGVGGNTQNFDFTAWN